MMVGLWGQIGNWEWGRNRDSMKNEQWKIINWEWGMGKDSVKNEQWRISNWELGMRNSESQEFGIWIWDLGLKER